MSSTLILPRIHLGGTYPSTLLADYSAAHVALSDALRLLGDTFHDRDYYLLGETTHRAARGQHLDRCAAIGSVIVALRAMEKHALDERNARDKARAHLIQEAANWVQHEMLHARAAAEFDADHHP